MVASEPPTFITCDLSQIEEKLKQLKCMQNNTVDPHYTSLAQVGKALSEQGTIFDFLGRGIIIDPSLINDRGR